MTVAELEDRLSDKEYTWWRTLYVREADEQKERE